jgi:hypothetical protein
MNVGDSTHCPPGFDEGAVKRFGSVLMYHILSNLPPLSKISDHYDVRNSCLCLKDEFHSFPDDSGIGISAFSVGREDLEGLSPVSVFGLKLF